MRRIGAPPVGPEPLADVRTCASSRQGYPDESEKSLLPQILGIWKTVIIR